MAITLELLGRQLEQIKSNLRTIRDDQKDLRHELSTKVNRSEFHIMVDRFSELEAAVNGRFSELNNRFSGLEAIINNRFNALEAIINHDTVAPQEKP